MICHIFNLTSSELKTLMGNFTIMFASHGTSLCAALANYPIILSKTSKPGTSSQQKTFYTVGGVSSGTLAFLPPPKSYILRALKYYCLEVIFSFHSSKL
ncbi:MAG TPA: hypothetical protein PKL64_05975 [Bacteroidales bacterium]|nr:hypothetical protein [Bacteroidales bacterium]